MEIYESNQPLQTRKQPPEKNNGRIHHRPDTREINSRHKSPTPRRFPSPNTTTRAVTPQPKRSVSTGKRPPGPPPQSPPTPTTPVHDTFVYTELAVRKTNGNKMQESLWPSRMRSLSVAFQSNTFSMPIGKKEKPPPQTFTDRALKPSLNVSPKQTISSPTTTTTTTYRKPTPERKRSPLKGKNTIDQSENSRPLDHGSHSRWPSRKITNISNKSIEAPENQRRISNLVSSSSLEKNGPVNTGSLSPGCGSRVASPFRARAIVSPNHMRSSSPSRQLCNSNNTASVLTFIADIKKGKKVANRIEDAHNLRLLYNRQLQWRFVNASSEAVLNSQKSTAERSLISAQRTTLQLKESVAAKRINICQLKLQLKLYLALNQQIAYLNQWSLIERDHSFSLHGVIEDLQASTLRLPVTGCATANIQSVKSALYSAIQVFKTMGSSLQSTLSKLEETNWVVSELATVAAQEKALVDECESLMASASSLQVEEYSLRTNLVQLKQGMIRQ